MIVDELCISESPIPPKGGAALRVCPTPPAEFGIQIRSLPVSGGRKNSAEIKRAARN
jgi:hypothetical protein